MGASFGSIGVTTEKLLPTQNSGRQTFSHEMTKIAYNPIKTKLNPNSPGKPKTYWNRLYQGVSTAVHHPLCRLRRRWWSAAITHTRTHTLKSPPSLSIVLREPTRNRNHTSPDRPRPATTEAACGGGCFAGKEKGKRKGNKKRMYLSTITIPPQEKQRPFLLLDSLPHDLLLAGDHSSGMGSGDLRRTSSFLSSLSL